MVSRSPLVSIKIASYNHGRFIGQTIQSVLDQSFADFELIIIDDGSRDNSIEVIESYNDPRIRVLSNEQNLGAAATSKRAQALCRGKYFCSLDSDDYFDREKLARQIAYMQERPGVDVLGTFVHLIDRLGKLLPEPPGGNWFSQNLDFNQPDSWLHGNHLCHSSVLMKR
jgi:glycosyltransferase involved in cell wall biosynthesis